MSVECLESRVLLSASSFSAFGDGVDARWAGVKATLALSSSLSSASALVEQSANTPFAQLGSLVRFAQSSDSATLQPLATFTGESEASLFGRGVRRVWWQGELTYSNSGEWIVGLDGDPVANVARLQTLFGGLAGTDSRAVKFLGTANSYLVRADDSLGFAALNAALATLPGVQFVEPNFVAGRPQAEVNLTMTPSDPNYGSEWALAKINAPAAWDVTTGSNQIVVADLDNGGQINHPDLAANIWTNPFEIAGNGLDDDNNGYIDDDAGWNFGSNTNVSDVNTHGTHTAGTIGAVGNNGVGVTGVVWNVKVMSLDIFTGTTTDTAQIISALSYVADMKRHGVNVVATNNSYGDLLNSTALNSALAEQANLNILFVAAAGNNGQDVTTSGFWPGTNGSVNTICVAASDENDARASYSNWSATRVHIAAPGSNIYSTVPGGYGYLSGTSMATPHVTGLVALAYSVAPDASFNQIRQAIFDGGVAVDWASTPTITNKRIDAKNTIDLVRTNVSGTLFLDSDADGVFDSTESPLIAGWKVYDDANGNGTRDTSETYATVQANGNYTILLTPGAHTLRVEVGSGYTRTAGSAGLAVTLASFQSLTNSNFGVYASGAQIAGAVYLDANKNGARDAGESGISGTPVYIDINDNSVRDLDVNRTIAGSGVNITSNKFLSRTVSSTIATTGVGSVLDVNVRVNITKANLSSLSISLISPLGTAVALIPTLSGSNMTNTVFDDQASVSISSGAAPYTGTFRPANSLSAFIGESGTGNWKLQITNAADGKTGTLDNWSLILKSDDDEPLTNSNADGSYRFTGLAAGTYNVRQVQPDGWSQIAPTNDGALTVTVTSNQTVSALDFGDAPPAPSVFSLAPVIGPTAGGTVVTISGANFVSVTSVTFGGVEALTFTVNSATQITATAPGHAPAAVDVVVSNPGGSGSLAGGGDFTYIAPAVASVVVNGGPDVTLGSSNAAMSLAGQHAIVKQILVTFKENVTVASDAFLVTPRTTNVTVSGGAAPSTAAAITSVTMISPSEYLVTFIDDGGHSTRAGGILNSGIYDLTTLAAKVSSGSTTMAVDRVDTFFVMFGNVEAANSYTSATLGDGLSHAFVDPGSLFQFSDAFGADASLVGRYNPTFDANLDGFIDPGDLFAFSDAFGIDWSF